MGLCRRRLSQLLPLLLSALLVCIQSQDQKSAFAIVGEDFTFSPKVNEMIKEITWKKGKNKVAELEGEGSPDYFPPLDNDRGVLDRSSGNLTIRNLNTLDAAEYEAQVLVVGSNQLQITKFVLEVLDPPSLVLNCSVTNDQINISCESHFSKNVTYSWNHADKGKVIKVDGSVVQFEKNADLPEQVVCNLKVSKTKISSSISLSACPQESSESLTRGRNGLIVIFVVVLIIIMIALFFTVWKKGWFNNILNRMPTSQSAAYKTEEQLKEDEALQRKNGRKEDEATNMEEKPLFAESPQSGNQSQDDKNENTRIVLAESHQNAKQSHDDEEPEYENENVRVSKDAADRSDEATNMEEKPLFAESPQSGNQSQDDKKSLKEDENTESGPDEVTNMEKTQQVVPKSAQSSNQRHDEGS